MYCFSSGCAQESLNYGGGCQRWSTGCQRWSTGGDSHVEVPEHLCFPGPPSVALVGPHHLDGHVIAYHDEEKYQKLS